MANPVQSGAAADADRNLAKRQKLTDHQRQNHHDNQEQSLIPGLPDHIAHLSLSLFPPSLLYSVCHSWRRLIYSCSFPPFRSLYAVFASTGTDLQHSNSIHFLAFDPISARWESLPPPPQDPPLGLVLRHPSFISRHLPIQTVSVSGRLVLLAATNQDFFPAIPRPLVFDPLSRTWSYGPPLATPRRWCAAGGTRGVVYVASGIGSHFSNNVAKSVEKWDLRNRKTTKSSPKASSWKWEKLKDLRDGRFSRDAVDAVGWKGKLCMVNNKGDAAKEGAVYDVENDEWEDMPEGMVAGWKGPVATMDEEVMYVVNEAKGALRKYDPESDHWEHLLESDRLRGAQQMAAGGGKVCVICSDSDGIVVLDVLAVPVRFWVVQTPPGLEPVAVHILPRLTRLEF